MVRVSTEKQSLGLEAQRSAIEDAATELGLPLAAIFEEFAVSGGSELEDRPILIDALAAVGEGDTLICAKRDRLSREPYVVLTVERMLKKIGAKLHSALEPATNGDEISHVVTKTVLDLTSLLERLNIKVRTRAALAAKKKRNERTGTVAFGFRVGVDGKTLEPDPSEQAVIAVARRLRDSGLSWSQMAIELYKLGARSRVGGAFRAEQVKGVLGERRR